MTGLQLIVLANRYQTLLREQYPTSVEGKCSAWPSSAAGQAGHLLYVLSSVKTYVEQDRFKRAARWLGFAEGALVGLGILTLSDVQVADIETSIEIL